MTWSEPEYVEPTTPAGRDGLTPRGAGLDVGSCVGGGIVAGGADIFKPNCIAAVWAGEPESVTVTVNEKLPLEVGAPEITPAEDRLSPEGNCPPVTLQVYAGVPPFAVNATL